VGYMGLTGLQERSGLDPLVLKSIDFKTSAIRNMASTRDSESRCKARQMRPEVRGHSASG
jgi:hypothetical protein